MFMFRLQCAVSFRPRSRMQRLTVWTRSRITRQFSGRLLFQKNLWINAVIGFSREIHIRPRCVFNGKSPIGCSYTSIRFNRESCRIVYAVVFEMLVNVDRVISDCANLPRTSGL